MATRIPILAYPAAFGGALVLGRLVAGGGSGPASDAAGGAGDTTKPTTADDGWGGFDSSGTQFPADGTGGGVLPTPVDGGNGGSTPPPTGSTVTDINGAAPDRIGVRPAGATGWVSVSGRAAWYQKAGSAYTRTYADMLFTAWCGTPFAVKGSWGTTNVAKILSGSHAGKLLGLGSTSVRYTRG